MRLINGTGATALAARATYLTLHNAGDTAACETAQGRVASALANFMNQTFTNLS